MRLGVRLMAVQGALALSACVAGPDYRPPALTALEVPPTYSVANDPSARGADVRWWDRFGDPDLTRLEEAGLAANLDIAQALSRLRQVREALVQALNDYAGAVILISHDRHMVELTADRLVLVDGGTAKDYPGSIEDYIDFVLGRNQPKGDAGKGGSGGAKPKGGAKNREEMKALQKAVSEAESAVGKAEARLAAIDAALAGSGKPAADLAGLTVAELGRQRREVVDQLAAAEARWIEAGEALDTFMN